MCDYQHFLPLLLAYLEAADNSEGPAKFRSLARLYFMLAPKLGLPRYTLFLCVLNLTFRDKLTDIA